MDIWIVEENEEFTEFGSAMFPYHECVVYIVKSILVVFLRASFVLHEVLHEDVGDYRRNRRAHS